MDNVTPYTIENAQSGSIRRIIRVADNLEIAIDPDNDDYLEFVRWAAKQAVPVGLHYDRLPQDAAYLGRNDLTKLTDFCKSHAKLIYVMPGKQKYKIAAEPITLKHAPLSVISEPSGRNVVFHQLYFGIPQEKPCGDESGLRMLRVPIFVTPKLLEELNRQLEDDDSTVRCVSTLPVEKTFVYFDVSGFSRDHFPGHQVGIIHALQGLTNDFRWWPEVGAAFEAWEGQEASLCIGDGFIYVFRKSFYAAFFAAYLAYLVEWLIAKGKLYEFHFRVGVHTGPVLRFWDVSPGSSAPRWNYLGRGIIEAQRVLTAIGKHKDDVVFVSAETRRAIQRDVPTRSPYQIIPWLENRGRQSDKHDEFRRLYEVNHSRWIMETHILDHLEEWYRSSKHEHSPRVWFDQTPPA